LQSFAASRNSLADRSDVFTGLLPPLAPVESGVDLDFSLLLVADQLVSDLGSFKSLQNYSYPQVKRIVDSLLMLANEGFLEFRDYRADIAHDRAFIDKAVDTTMRDFTLWIPPLQNQIKIYDRLLPRFRRQFGPLLSEWDSQTFGVACYLLEETGKID